MVAHVSRGGAWKAAATGFAGALVLFAVAYLTAAPAIPRVEGTVISTRAGKSPRIEVETAGGRATIFGEPETYAACRPGMQIVKPAFDTAYWCAGRPAARTSWFFYAVVLLEAALGFASAYAGVVAWIRLRRREG